MYTLCILIINMQGSPALAIHTGTFQIRYIAIEISITSGNAVFLSYRDTKGMTTMVTLIWAWCHHAMAWVGEAT